MKEKCKHKWRVGSYVGGIKNDRLTKTAINIWCEKCKAKIVADYNPYFTYPVKTKKGWGRSYGLEEEA